MTHKKTIKKRFENQINFWLKLQIQKENIFCTVSNFLQRHRLKNCIRIKNKRKMLKNPFHFVNKPNGSQVKMVNDPDYPLKLNQQTVIPKFFLFFFRKFYFISKIDLHCRNNYFSVNIMPNEYFSFIDL